MRVIKAAACVLSIAALAAIVAASVYAMFSSATSSLPSSFGSSALPAPGSPTATGSSAPVTIAWTASSINGTIAAQSYTVERYSGSGADLGAACGGSAVTGLSCTDSPAGDGRFEYKVTAHYGGWSTTGDFTNSVSLVPDAPVSVSLTNGGGQGNAYIDSANASSVNVSVELDASSEGSDTVTLSAHDAGSANTLSASTPATAGAGTVKFDGLDLSLFDDGTVTFTATVTDSDSDTSTGATTDVTKDTVAPANALSLTAQAPAGSSFLSGSTVYYRGTGGGAGGSFGVRNAVSDALSGPGSSTTAPFGGTTTGWTHTPGTASTPAGGPFDSSPFAWSEGTSSSPTEVVTGADIAGNTTAAPALSFVNDSTPPDGAVLVVNGQNASASGTTGYSSSTSFDIGTRTDFTDSGSGLASSVLTVQSFALSSSHGVAGGTCAGAPSGPFAAATTIPATTQPTGFTTGYCYTYTLTGTDNVGNTASISTTVKVDTTGPSAPVVTLSAATGNTFISGSTVYIDPQAGDSGTFAVGATSADPDSGIQKISFPSLTGFASGGGDSTSSPYQTTYAWSGAGASGSGSQTVTAYDNAGLTNSGSFTLTPDTTAPSGGSVTVNGLVGTDSSYSSSLSVSLSLAEGTDGGSGVAPSGAALFRAQGTLSSDGQADGTC